MILKHTEPERQNPKDRTRKTELERQNPKDRTRKRQQRKGMNVPVGSESML